MITAKQEIFILAIIISIISIIILVKIENRKQIPIIINKGSTIEERVNKLEDRVSDLERILELHRDDKIIK